MESKFYFIVRIRVRGLVRVKVRVRIRVRAFLNETSERDFSRIYFVNADGH